MRHLLRSFLFTALAFALLTPSQAQFTSSYSLSAIGTPVIETFDSLGQDNSALGSEMLPFGIPNLSRWRGARVGGTGSSFAYLGLFEQTSVVTSGSAYNCGTSGNARRMLGLRASGTTEPAVAARFRKNTGSTVTSLQFRVRFAQWVQGNNAAVERIQFEYSTNATDVNGGTWTPATALDLVEFVSPTGTSGGNLDGYANTQVLVASLSGISVANGSTIAIRWRDVNDAGNDMLMAIDSLYVTPFTTGAPAMTVSSDFRLFYTDAPGTPSATQTLAVSGANLSGNITVAVPAPFQARLESGETDANYRNSITLTPAAGTVAATNILVRFNPTVPGLQTALGSVSATGLPTQSGLLVGTTLGLGQIRAEQITRLGTTQTARGRIHTLGTFNRSELVIQDGTGGLTIFVENEANPGAYFASLGLAVGDSISVVGTLKEFGRRTTGMTIDPVGARQLQIGGPTSGPGSLTITQLSPGTGALPRALTIAAFADSVVAEAVESMVIGFANVTVANQGYAYWREETNYVAQDGSLDPSGNAATTVLRTGRRTDLFNNNTDVWQVTALPSPITTLAGIGGQFQGQHQVRLRRRADIAGATNTIYLNAANSAIAQNQTLDIATWNGKWIGHPTSGPSQDVPSAQVDSIAALIVRSGFDIVALQEISSVHRTLFDDAANTASLLNRLNARAPVGTTYTLAYSPAPVQSQALGMVYKATEGGSPLVTQVSAPAFFLNSSGTTGWAAFSNVRRVPIEVRVRYNAGAQGNRFLRIINLHGDAGGTVTDVTRRTTDYAELKTFLDASRASDSLVILGDFNDLVVGNLTAVGGNSPMKPFVDDASNYRALTQPLASLGLNTFAGSGLISFIDHIFVSNELFPAVLAGTTRPINPWTANANYTFTTADHYPVVTRLRFDLTLSTEAQTVGTRADAVTVFPNPTTGRLTVRFDLASATDASVQLLDAAGVLRQVLQPRTRLSAGEHSLELAATAGPGLYLVVVETAEGRRAVTKLVVTE